MSIIQQATITKIDDDKLFLSICRAEACGACKAQSACSSSGGGKEIILENDGRQREVGDQVNLKISRHQGFLAIMIAYLVPVALIIGILMWLQWLALSEVISGVITLAVIVVYFILLRVFRSKFETELTIEIE